MQFGVAKLVSGWLIGAFFITHEACAQSIHFSVSDQHGNPVTDAVVLIDVDNYGQLTQSSANKIAVMDQINKRFEPKILTIYQGSDVHFPNSDQIRHHVYSFSKPKVFEIELYAKQPDQPIRFDHAGLVVLGCNIHDSMVGYILVSDTPFWSQSNEIGEVQLQDPQNIKTLRIWHPGMMDGFQPMPLPIPKNGAQITLQLRSAPDDHSSSSTHFSNQRFKRYAR